MKKAVTKAMLRSLGFNILGMLFGCFPFIFLNRDQVLVWGLALLILIPLALLVQLIVAIVYLNIPLRKESGQGMLISAGFFYWSG
jgi:hypothetical protein